MAFRADCYAFVQRVSMAPFPVQRMMEMEMHVPVFQRRSAANPACVIVALEYGGAQVVRVIQRPVLVILAMRRLASRLHRGQERRVENADFNDYARNGRDFAYADDEGFLRLFLMLQRWRDPSFLAFPVVEARLAVALPVPACSPVCAAVVMAGFFVCQERMFRRHELAALRLKRQPDVLIAAVDAKFQILNVFRRRIQEPDRERLATGDFPFAVLEQMPDAADRVVGISFVPFMDSTNTGVIVSPLNRNSRTASAWSTSPLFHPVFPALLAGRRLMHFPCPSGMFSMRP